MKYNYNFVNLLTVLCVLCTLCKHATSSNISKIEKSLLNKAKEDLWQNSPKDTHYLSFENINDEWYNGLNDDDDLTGDNNDGDDFMESSFGGRNTMMLSKNEANYIDEFDSNDMLDEINKGIPIKSRPSQIDKKYDSYSDEFDTNDVVDEINNIGDGRDSDDASDDDDNGLFYKERQRQSYTAMETIDELDEYSDSSDSELDNEDTFKIDDTVQPSIDDVLIDKDYYKRDSEYRKLLSPSYSRANSKDRVDNLIKLFNEMHYERIHIQKGVRYIIPDKIETYYELLEFVDTETYDIYPKEYDRIKEYMLFYDKELNQLSEYVKYQQIELEKIAKNRKILKKPKKLLISVDDTPIPANMAQIKIRTRNSMDEKEAFLEELYDKGYDRKQNTINESITQIRRNTEARPAFIKDEYLGKLLLQNIVVNKSKEINDKFIKEYEKRIDFLKDRRKKLYEMNDMRKKFVVRKLEKLSPKELLEQEKMFADKIYYLENEFYNMMDHMERNPVLNYDGYTIALEYDNNYVIEERELPKVVADARPTSSDMDFIEMEKQFSKLDKIEDANIKESHSSDDLDFIELEKQINDKSDRDIPAVGTPALIEVNPKDNKIVVPEIIVDNSEINRKLKYEKYKKYYKFKKYLENRKIPNIYKHRHNFYQNLKKKSLLVYKSKLGFKKKRNILIGSILGTAVTIGGSSMYRLVWSKNKKDPNKIEETLKFDQENIESLNEELFMNNNNNNEFSLNNINNEK